MNLGTPIATGNTAKIYLYKNKIAKVFNDDLPVTASSYEANKQNYALSCGLNVPKIVDVTEIDGKQAIIMDYVEGQTLGEIVSANMEQAEYYIDLSIDIQQEIHGISTDIPESMSEKLSRQIQSAHSLDHSHKSALLRKLDAMKFESRLCHGDYHLFNLIMSDGKVTIIDWVDSNGGDLRADVCRTYLLYSQFSAELADMYLRLYCRKSGLAKDEIFQWTPIIAGARLSENVPSENSKRLLEIVYSYCSS